MSQYNPTVKRYNRDVGTMVPNVEFCPTEFPRLHAHPAPYLPLQGFIEKHSDYYVVMTGKVIAHDSLGFLVPAGYKIEQESTEALTNFGTGNVNFVTADLIKYDQTDVDNGVVNSRGVTVAVGEPVVYSMLRKGGVALPNFNSGFAGSSSAVDCNGVMTWAVTIGDHIGVAPYSWIRTSSDVMSRGANEHMFNTGSATGMEARKAVDDGTQLRHDAWQLQLEPKTVRTNYCLEYPVVADTSGLLIPGQAVAIAGAMSSFSYGDRVTFNRDSNIVPATPASVTCGVLTGDDAADRAAVNTALAAVLTSVQKYHKRIVGQVIKKDVRHPRSLLDKVKTRWDSTIPGFDAIEKMPGSATSGYPWNMHTAGATLGTIVISQAHK